MGCKGGAGREREGGGEDVRCVFSEEWAEFFKGEKKKGKEREGERKERKKKRERRKRGRGKGKEREREKEKEGGVKGGGEREREDHSSNFWVYARMSGLGNLYHHQTDHRQVLEARLARHA